MARKKVLNLGCGSTPKEYVHQLFLGDDWEHVRVDLNPEMKPDVVDDLAKLEKFQPGDADGIFSSHSLEHLQPMHAVLAMRRWHTVLRPGGLVVIVCPDLQSACEAVARGDAAKALYISQAGAICALDMIFGFSGFTVQEGGELMGHRWGYTERSLERLMCEAGFVTTVCRAVEAFELVGFGRKV